MSKTTVGPGKCKTWLRMTRYYFIDAYQMKNKNVMAPTGPSLFMRLPKGNCAMKETLDHYVKITSILELNIHLIPWRSCIRDIHNFIAPWNQFLHQLHHYTHGIKCFIKISGCFIKCFFRVKLSLVHVLRKSISLFSLNSSFTKSKILIPNQKRPNKHVRWAK